MTDWFNYPLTHGYIPTHLASDWDSPHFAVDIAMPRDTPITALKSGKVEQADYAVWDGKQGGGEVWVKPDDGSPEYYYYHLDQNEVKVGQHVQQGEEVGLSGGQNSGGRHNTDPSWSTGEHLHVGYFTAFQSTPIGVRPYGPDITSTIANMHAGILPTQSPTQAAQASSINWKSIGYLAGIFVLGIIIVIAGSMFLMDGPPTNKKGSAYPDKKLLVEGALA